MEPVIHKFRGAVVGGFDRNDVLQFMEQNAKEHRAQLDELNARLMAAEEEKEALSASLFGLECQNHSLEEQEAKVRASLEESSAALAQVRGELQQARDELAAARQELTGLQGKLALLEPMAKDYEALKDRIATVELDAHRTAQATIDAAQAQAESIKAEACRWVKDLQRKYEDMRKFAQACVKAAGEMEAAFDTVEQDYQTLTRLVDEEEGR